MSELKTYLQKAYKEKFAIGAFNVYNLESIQAVATAVRQTKRPAIMQVSEKALDYAGSEELISLMKIARKNNEGHLFIHLDHGKDPENVKKCIIAKFDSVMFDGSHLDIDENIEISSNLAEFAKRRQVVFEAEIGKIGGKEDFVNSSNFKTNPAEALMFYQKVKPDMMAVAIGNVHGVRTASEQLDFALLAKIQDMVKAPIVLHGCSNRSDRDYKIAISEGVVKINIDTELRQAFIEGLRKGLKKSSIDPREVLMVAMAESSKKVVEKIDLFAGGCC